MRLIDVDAVMREWGMSDKCEECKQDPRLCMYNDNYTLMRFCEALSDAPTIPAIPVEWLESKCKEALHEGMRPDEVEAIEMVLWMWQKEQEARNEPKV